MKAIFTFLLTLFSLVAWTQILEPVKWEMSSEAISDTEYDLIFKAVIDDGWSIYSQHTDPSGPVPTSFNFDAGDHYTRSGNVAEKGKKKEGADPLFDGVTVIKFTQSPVIFTQRVTVTDVSKPIAGWLEFMTCDDERCLPPTEVDFSFKVERPSDKSGEVAPSNAPENPKVVEETVASTESGTNILEEDTAEEDLADVGLANMTITETIPDDGLLHPVQWRIDVSKMNDSEYLVNFTAELQEGWDMYSQFTEDNGPIPTAFIIEDGEEASIMKMDETGDMSEGMDETFGVVVKKFKHGPVQFSNVVDGTKNLKGYIEYMSCTEGKCIPFDRTFVISFDPLKLSWEEEEEIGGSPPVSIDSLYHFDRTLIEQEPFGLCGEEMEEEKTMWQIFFLGFLGGLIALLTPCVFPMIPLTVSFFTKGSENRSKGISNAVLYGFFILLVYIVLSIPFHLMDSLNPDILNEISTNVWLNVAFFVIFLFFAFSFFGYYELTLPESWTNKASSAEGAGGIIGIFFMALTLALVSFSCTGPILGSLLVGSISSDGGAMQLTAGMGGFGLALALPFALFAAFPSMMQALPKSGGWLNSVKVVLGFLELGLALKFLSNADLVKHWDFLKLELFLGLWILIGIGLALYLFGKLKFPHDSPIKKLSPFRMGLGVLTVVFVVYLMSGFRTNDRTNAYEPLTLLSGLAPPVCYSFWKPCDCPQGLECFKDLNEGLSYARENNKPILIDFTGYACVNCRKMEEHVWPRNEVYSLINEDYVLISLYVDDKKELPEVINYQKRDGTVRRLRTYGHLWANFEEEYFNNNAQPYYVLLSPEGRRLNLPRGYTPNAEEYGYFLECGLENYKASIMGQLGEK